MARPGLLKSSLVKSYSVEDILLWTQGVLEPCGLSQAEDKQNDGGVCSCPLANLSLDVNGNEC